MKKPFSFDERSKTVVCSNPKCAQVRGAEGVARMPIKENVAARQTTIKPLMCYDCNVFFKTGKNRHQRKAEDVKRRAVIQEKVLKTMAAIA